MMDNFTLPEEDDEEIDIYAALGLNTPIEENQTGVNIYDPLAAFMDEDDDDDVVAHGMFVETASPVSSERVEALIATLARDLLDEEILHSSLEGGRVDLSSVKVERDRDAYHLSLIVDMGGHQIKPFATVLAVENNWKPLAPPKGLHARWKPLYESLCRALTSALAQQGQPSTI